jgi:hypothetical protein
MPHRTILALAALVVVSAAPLAAQTPPPALTERVGQVRFGVPPRYTRDAAFSDSAIAVYHDAASASWLFVAPLARTEDRPGVILQLLRRLGKAGLGAASEQAEWELAPGVAARPVEGFYEQLQTLGIPGMHVSVRQMRTDGRDVLAGYAFVSREASARSCWFRGNGPGSRGERWLAASLLRTPSPGDAAPEGFAEAPSDFSGFGGSDRPNPEKDRVLAVWNAYTAALKDHRGADAAALVTPAVAELYADLKTLALHGTSEQIHTLPVLLRTPVLSLRHRLEPARLAAMTPREVVAFGAQEDASFSGQVTPGEPVFLPGMAWLPLMTAGGTPTGFRVALLQVGGEWRIDLIPLIAAVDCQTAGRLHDRGITREQQNSLLLHQLEVSTGRAPSPRIWEPLIP